MTQERGDFTTAVRGRYANASSKRPCAQERGDFTTAVTAKLGRSGPGGGGCTGVVPERHRCLRPVVPSAPLLRGCTGVVPARHRCGRSSLLWPEGGITWGLQGSHPGATAPETLRHQSRLAEPRLQGNHPGTTAPEWCRPGSRGHGEEQIGVRHCGLDAVGQKGKHGVEESGAAAALRPDAGGDRPRLSRGLRPRPAAGGGRPSGKGRREGAAERLSVGGKRCGVK